MNTYAVVQAAFKWFTRSGHAGNPEGMLNVGLCYTNGVGVPESKKMADEWLTKASQLGLDKAVKMTYLRSDPRLKAEWNLTRN